ncbi:MAG: PilC/PilY family type IV pilus protein [Desulfobacterales bacterium]
MKTKYMIAVTGLVCWLSLLLTFNQGYTSDTCMFAVTADDLPPNIVFLLDNGVEMKHPATPAGYDSGVDYTPTVGEEVDVVANGVTGNGFFNPNGYGIYITGGRYYLVPVDDNLELKTDIRLEGLPAADRKTSTWTINEQTVHLPAEANAEVDADGIKDNAGAFRYSKNYLNWLFFYTTSLDLDNDGEDEPIYDGAALPDKSRFYYAKKALLTAGKLSSNKALFAIYNFTSDEGASNVQGLDDVVDTLGETAEGNILNPDYVNNINNMGTVTYSPLAEGMATIGAYYNSNSSGEPDTTNYCQKNFVIAVTPGMSSEDTSSGLSQTKPSDLIDYDQDSTDGYGENDHPGQGTLTVDDTTYTITTHINGSTYMDDVAAYFYANDMRMANDKTEAFQNVMTYTVGFMASPASRVFLINTSNNGNGKTNLTNSADPDYGKYHFDAESAEGLSQAILDAVNSIISRTSSFTAPVVPVTRTTSGNRIYMAFFKPLDQNFWEGNVTKFGLSTDNAIIGSDGNAATWPNGAMREDAQAFWQTIDWADTSKSNGIYNYNRNIYTYLGSDYDLNNSGNRFATDNEFLTAEILGNPSDVTVNGSLVSGKEKVIQYMRGADVLDQDGDLDVNENRSVITGDVLHSEPLVYTYRYADNSAITMVFFGSNDGMLHAVLDTTDPDVDVSGDETDYGTEAWAFISPDQLARLKDILEGSVHQDYVDGSPKVYFHDVDADGMLDTADGDKVILVCGLRKGGSSYFALNITNPNDPQYLWQISQTSDNFPDLVIPKLVVIPELGQSWSEPQFGVVKTGDDDPTGTIVCFIGGGYSSNHSAGKAVIAVNVLTGAVVKKFTIGMYYSVASSVKVVDADDNGFVDKVYVGDLGGQMWRFGQVYIDAQGYPLNFPDCNENINSWMPEIVFAAPTYTIESTTYNRKFYYPPSVTLEKGYDLLFMGTGDRENACDTTTAADRIYCVKDTHGSIFLTEANLVDVTDPTSAPPDLSQTNSNYDQGWYIRLVDSSGDTEVAAGEKVLSRGIVFYKTYYVTTFAPNSDPCVPGGNAKIYALNYLTGEAVIKFSDLDDDGDMDLARSVLLGGGIPSKPVVVITSKGQKMFISLGSTNPDAASQSIGAGIIEVDPLYPKNNFFYLWWRELLN